MLTTTQLARQHGVSGAYIRKLRHEGRISPLATLPSGQYLWADEQEMPAKRKRGRPKGSKSGAKKCEKKQRRMAPLPVQPAQTPAPLPNDLGADKLLDPGGEGKAGIGGVSLPELPVSVSNADRPGGQPVAVRRLGRSSDPRRGR